MKPKPGDLVCFDPDKLSERQKQTFNLKSIFLLLCLPMPNSLPGIATILAGEDKVPVSYKYLKRYEPEKEI